MNEIKLGWLSPTAEMIECNSYEHISTAYNNPRNPPIIQHIQKQLKEVEKIGK